MEIIVKKSQEKFIKAKNEWFMRQGKHRRAAFNVLQERAKLFEQQGKSREEFALHCQKRGFMKTDDDKAIVSKVMSKVRLDKDSSFLPKKVRHQKLVERALKGEI